MSNRLLLLVTISWLSLLANLAVAGDSLLPDSSAQEQVLRDDEARFQHLRFTDGLSQSLVYSIAQDQRGYLWFGTRSGLNRFDGHRFLVLRHQPDNPQTLANSDINTLLVTADGYLWVGLPDGLDRLDPDTLEVTHFGARLSALLSEKPEQGEEGEMGKGSSARETNNEAMVPPGAESFVWKLFEDASRRLWISSDVGLFVYDAEIDSMVRFADPQLTGELHFTQTADGRVWTALGNCLLELDLTLRAAQQRFCINPGATINTLLADDNALWVASASRIQQFTLTPQTEQGVSPATSVSAVTTASVDFTQRAIVNNMVIRGADLWYSSQKGIGRINRTNQTHVRYQHEAGNSHSILKDYVNFLFTDADQRLWVATVDGISHWDPAIRQLGHLLTDSQTAEFGENNLTSVTSSRSGNILAGSEDHGVYELDPKSMTIRNWASSKRGGNELCSDQVTALLEDFAERIWIGTSTCLTLIDQSSGARRDFQFNGDQPVDFENAYITTIFEDQRGVLWVATPFQLYRFNPEFVDGQLDISGSEFEAVELLDSFVQGQSPINTIHEDLSGHLWLGGTEGVLRIRQSSGEQWHYRHEIGNPRSLSSDEIYSIYEDYQGNIWIGAINGVNRVVQHPDSDSLYFVLELDDSKLVNSYVAAMQGDDSGHLWIATFGGLVRYHPDLKTIEHFFYEDGLQSNEFYWGAAHASRNEQLLFAGPNGLNLFYPKQIPNNGRQLLPTITELRVDGELVQIDSADNGAIELDLQSRTDQVQMALSTLTFLPDSSIEYRYRRGTDTHWQSLNRSSDITLVDLPAGVFEMVIQARRIGDRWPDQALPVNLQVRGSIWNQNLLMFLVMLGVFTVSYLLLFSRYRTWKVRSRTVERAERKHLERQRVLEKENEFLARKNTKQNQVLQNRQATIDLMQQQLDATRFIDSVSGFRNRHFLREKMPAEIEGFLRKQAEYPALKLSLMKVEIDGFDYIRNHYGVMVVENMARQVADVVSQSALGSDILIRWSERSFLIVGQTETPKDKIYTAERIRNFVASRKFDLGNGMHVDMTCTIGFTQLPLDPNQADAVNWQQSIDLIEQGIDAIKGVTRNAWIGFQAGEAVDGAQIADRLAFDLAGLINDNLLSYTSSLPRQQTITFEV